MTVGGHQEYLASEFARATSCTCVCVFLMGLDVYFFLNVERVQRSVSFQYVS